MGLRKSGFAFLLGALPIIIISVCARATDNMVSTTLPLLGKYVFGLGTIYGGIATSVYSITGLFANYVVNPRISGTIRRQVFVGSMALVAVCCLLLAASNAVSAMVLGIVISFAFGIIYPSVIATISMASDQNGERLLALFALGLSASLVVGPSLESYLLSFSYATVFFAFTIITLLAFLASWRIQFTSIPRETWKPSQAATSGVYGSLLVASVFFLPFSAFTAFVPIFAAQVFGLGTAVAYASFVPLFVVSFLARAYMTARPFRNLVLPVAASFAITLGGIVSMVLAPNYAIFIVAMAFMGIPHGVTYTLSLIIVSRTSAHGERNVAVSRLSAYSNLSQSAIPLAIGYMIELVGIHLSFLVLLIPAVLSAALFVQRYRRVLV